MEKLGVIAIVLLALGSAAAAQDRSLVTATPEPEWRTVALHDGGVLRYVVPQVSAADYPPGARRREIEGRTVVLLVLSPASEIVSCSTWESSGNAELDSRACAIYRARGQFERRDARENISVRAPVRWELED